MVLSLVKDICTTLCSNKVHSYADVSIRQHTSAYVSILQHTYAEGNMHHAMQQQSSLVRMLPYAAVC